MAEPADPRPGERDSESVLEETAARLADRPGDDAAHERRSRALLALGRLDEAERHAADAVRIDPDEVRYRELLAEVLALRGAHADAATEYRDLARQDPALADWTLAEARERLDAAQADAAVEAARRAVRLDPRSPDAQLALARGLVRSGDGQGAAAAAGVAASVRPNDPEVREVLADARWLAGDSAAAFDGFRALSEELAGRDRERVIGKARRLYRQRAGGLGRMVAAISPVFTLALRAGWLHVR